MAEVKEVFGQYATLVNGKIKMFETRGEAQSAAVMEEQSGSFKERAFAYCESREIDVESKMAKGRMNVIIDFLAYESAKAEQQSVDESQF